MTTPPIQRTAPPPEPLPPLPAADAAWLDQQLELLTAIADDPRPAAPAAGKLHDHEGDDGHTGKIRNTAYMWLPGNKLTLLGPVGEVRQIVDLEVGRGRVASAGDPAPAGKHVMVTLTMTAPMATGRQVPQRIHTATARETRTVIGIVVGSIVVMTAAIAALMVVEPLYGWAVVAALFAVAYINTKRLKLAAHRLVPHVAIHHDDKHRPNH